jgi:phosphoglycerol transferase MdoB-like AlkP superfamily enzyme
MKRVQSLYRQICSFFPSEIRYLFKVYLLAVAVFVAFRMLLVGLYWDQIGVLPFSDWAYSLLVRGTAFDSVIAVQSLLFPLVVLTISYLGQLKSKVWNRVTSIYISVAFTLALGLCAADIPYFNYTNSRVSRNIFSWIDDLSTMTEALFTNVEYLIFIGLFLVVAFVFNRQVWIWHRQLASEDNTRKPAWANVGLYTFLVVVLFFGMRGRIKVDCHPLVIRDAFDTENTLVNQLCLNGALHFTHTLKEKNHRYMDDKRALELARNFLNADPSKPNSVVRMQTYNEPPLHANVVLVLMESMSAEKVGWYKPNTPSLTPVLDSLISKSLFFPNTYTANTRTANGIFSTLFSWPSIQNIKPTLSSDIAGAPLAGLPNTLKKNGYRNYYFCNGSLEFDNIKPLFYQNGFDRLIGSESYPPEQIAGVWGVSDRSLFLNSLEYLDSVSASDQPFLAVYNTVSTHPPHDLPTNEPVTLTAESKIDRSYQYADWALGQFMNEAAKKPWFNQTVFVFIADHGQRFNVVYDMPLSYNHVPFLVYAPQLIAPKTDENLALQIDVFPTIMGLLKQPFANNTLGIDLQREKRPFAFFSGDNRYGCLNDRFFLIMRYNNYSLYEYKNNSTVDVVKLHPQLVDSMKTHMQAMLQTTQYMFTNKQTGMHDIQITGSNYSVGISNK